MLSFCVKVHIDNCRTKCCLDICQYFNLYNILTWAVPSKFSIVRDCNEDLMSSLNV